MKVQCKLESADHESSQICINLFANRYLPTQIRFRKQIGLYNEAPNIRAYNTVNSMGNGHKVRLKSATLINAFLHSKVQHLSNGNSAYDNGAIKSATEFRIHDILVWIWIHTRGSMPLTNGSGSCYFRQWPSRRQQKIFFKKYFFLLLFYGTFTSFFKDKMSKRSHKTVGTKVFLTIFAWW